MNIEKLIQQLRERGAVASGNVMSSHSASVQYIKSGTEHEAILKIGRKEDDGKTIQNQAAFNAFVREHLDSLDLSSQLQVSKVLETGAASDIAYAIFEKLSGTPLGNQEQLTIVSGLKNWFDIFVNVLAAFDTVEHGKFPYNFKKGRQRVTQQFTERMQERAKLPLEKRLISSKDVSALQHIVETRLETADFRLQHHDFVPWNMIDVGNSVLGLIDAEWGSIRLRYYDIAYLYIKLMTNVKHKQLAAQWLETCSTAEKNNTPLFPDLQEKIRLPMSYRILADLEERSLENDIEGVNLVQEIIAELTT